MEMFQINYQLMKVNIRVMSWKFQYIRNWNLFRRDKNCKKKIKDNYTE